MTDFNPELYDAYVATFGEPGSTRIWTTGIDMARTSVTEEGIKHVLKHRTTEPTDKELKRYENHGIAVIHFPYIGSGDMFHERIIDTNEIPFTEQPRYAWFSKFRPEDLYVALSSGKQTNPSRNGTGLVEICPEKQLVGVAVSVYLKGLTHRQIPYIAKLIPLYSHGQAIKEPIPTTFSSP